MPPRLAAFMIKLCSVPTAMVQTPAQPLTLEAFLKLSEAKPAWEFIQGQISQKPMPQGKHSTIQSDLVSALNSLLNPSTSPLVNCSAGWKHNPCLHYCSACLLWK